jgi:hypothetical protein
MWDGERFKNKSKKANKNAKATKKFTGPNFAERLVLYTIAVVGWPIWQVSDRYQNWLKD